MQRGEPGRAARMLLGPRPDRARAEKAQKDAVFVQEAESTKPSETCYARFNALVRTGRRGRPPGRPPGEAAGLAGVEEELDCGKVYEGNAYVDPKLASLPKSLRAAADLVDRSKLARQAFGDHVVDFYVHTARLEVEEFDNAVTDWERQRYFERI